MHPFCILMFCFSGALLLYAGLLARTKDVGLIPKNYAVAMKDKSAYASAFAKMMSLVALAPMGAGIYGQIDPMLGTVVMFIGFVDCVWIGTYFFQGLTA